MKFAGALVVVLALGSVAPVWAQGADKVRLDDFALPSNQAEAGMEQIDGRIEKPPPLFPLPPPTTRDRQLVIPGPPRAEREPVSQISQVGQSTPTQQLSERSEARGMAGNTISSPDDSRPQASALLTGRDRCDPQVGTAQFESCLRILELRAAEFDAPEAPRLSAEQKLLIERDGDAFISATPKTKLGLASKDNPDAELQSNQELASVVLAPAPTPPAADGPSDPKLGDSMAEALRVLQIEMSAPKQP